MEILYESYIILQFHNSFWKYVVPNAGSWIAASRPVILYRISYFQTEYYNSDCKYLVDIREWGLAKSFLGINKIVNCLQCAAILCNLTKRSWTRWRLAIIFANSSWKAKAYLTSQTALAYTTIQINETNMTRKTNKVTQAQANQSNFINMTNQSRYTNPPANQLDHSKQPVDPTNIPDQSHSDIDSTSPADQINFDQIIVTWPAGPAQFHHSDRCDQYGPSDS
jgi:hypothetical protein